MTVYTHYVSFRAEVAMENASKYTNKQELEAQGFIKTPRGIYKLNALEQIYRNGRLEYGDKSFGGQDRLRAGMKLASDFEKSHFSIVNSSWQNEKVDCKFQNNNDINYIRSRYYTAVNSIPREFWPAVRQICIENKIPDFKNIQSARRRSENLYLRYFDLCRGLDRLIEHYLSRKIQF